MKTAKLKVGSIYNYRSNVENVDVKYVGYGLSDGYSFIAYNEDTGKYDGGFNCLSRMAVECTISPKQD